jgi:hypothetical protein
MAIVTSLRTKDGVADPLRAELAAAIKTAEEARAAADRQKAAIERTRSSRLRATAAVKVAEEGVGKAQEAHARAIADAAADDAAPPTSGMRAARQAVVDAQDEADALKAAVEELKARLPDFEAAAREADIAVEAAISAILAVQAQQLLAKADAIARELAPLRNALFALWKDNPSGTVDLLAFQRGRAPLAEVQTAVAAFSEAVNAIDKSDLWEQARDALRSNAYAPLPDFAPPPNAA